MDFHGTWGAPIAMIRTVPWNSMEFHWTWSAPISMKRAVSWNSMELGFRQFRRNCSFQRNIGALQVPWNSVEFHGTVCVSEIGELLLDGAIFIIETLSLNLSRIPWNLRFQILMKIIFNYAGWINFRKLTNTLYLFVSLFHQRLFYYPYLHYAICFYRFTHYVTKYHSKSLSKAHWN